MINRHGFTLIELLTVVVILAILTSIALPQYRKAIQRAEAANMLVALKTAFDASKRYYSSSGNWPSSLVGLDTTIQLNPGSTDQSGEFKYSFDQGVVDVCKLNGSNTCVYTMHAYYRHVNGQRDIYTCQANNDKYASLCESFGETKDSSGHVYID